MLYWLLTKKRHENFEFIHQELVLRLLMNLKFLKQLRMFYRPSHNPLLDHSLTTCCVHPSTSSLADIPQPRQKKQDFATATHGSMSKCIATNCLLMWMPPLFPPSDPPWMLVSLSPPVCLARPAKTDTSDNTHTLLGFCLIRVVVAV